ncbi:TlpA disulfide reductase family protein [Stenotrophomonas sp. SY1]|jgi:thiol-disulfide isomerase/thioredoxin|uniref:TlpA disulfide reductase family protein n=1 Tax=Stenotrophomonas sp. SY1 TaxID=477235 RepID=UPI001E482A73|nr:TlpA disulfide reductase family protein [Stenotrophomonas sp. SY1]MCD9088313.1 TlpA family protein disulfide reductase [Stenotrophomonas sp. SY1]
MRAATWWVAAIAAVAGVVVGVHYMPTNVDLPARMEDPSTPPPRTAVQAAKPGDMLPAFSLPDLDGMPVAFPDRFKGKPLLINVWASWCAPCIEEMPELARFAARHADNGPQVVGVALDTPEAVQDFLGNVPVYYPIVIETPGPDDASVKLGNTQGLLPYSVLVDAQGRILKQKLGPFKAGEIESWAATP